MIPENKQNKIEGILIRSTTATDCRTKNCSHENFCCAVGKYTSSVNEPEKRFTFVPDFNLTWQLRDFTLAIIIYCKSFEAVMETPILKDKQHQAELTFCGIEHAPR